MSVSFLGCVGICISMGEDFACEHWGKKDTEHFSLSCVIHHYAVSPPSSRPSCFQKFFWNCRICLILLYCSGCCVLVFLRLGFGLLFSPAKTSLLYSCYVPFSVPTSWVVFCFLLRSPSLGQAGILQTFPVFLQNKMVCSWAICNFSVEVSQQTFPSNACFTLDLFWDNKQTCGNCGQLLGVWRDSFFIVCVYFILFPSNWPPSFCFVCLCLCKTMWNTSGYRSWLLKEFIWIEFDQVELFKICLQSKRYCTSVYVSKFHSLA